MKHLSIDLETFSSVPIAKSGMYKYVQSPDFEILLMAYSVDNSPVEIIDLAQGEEIPDWLCKAIESPEYIKHAYNASFEWYCLSRYLKGEKLLPVNQWRDTMLHGLYCGFTAGLDATGKALGLSEDKRKLAVGKLLIRYFCIPCSPTKTNGGRTRNYPKHDPEKWNLFKTYCIGDVVTEMEIDRKLSKFPVPDDVQKQWETDLIINSRGVAVDMDLVHGALSIANSSREKLMNEAIEITGLENPNSVAQLSRWLETETDKKIYNLRKDTVAQILKNRLVTGVAERVLQIRQELGKTSTKKYDAIETAVCDDNRVRGLLQFYGANRTGRFAGRLVQVQNLPRTYIDIKQLPMAREFVKNQESEKLNLLFGSIQNTLSQLIRTSFIASENKTLVDADFSSIEARVIAWLAQEEWKIKIFEDNSDIYCATASSMFGVPVEKHGANSELRQKGKIAELACIAEGQLVLTNKGLVPIELITIEHRLWDGEEWVKHDGVIYRGEKEVIEYDGLTATTDHLVWVEGQIKPIQFGIAIICGAHIIQTGNGCIAIQLRKNYHQPQKTQELLKYCGKAKVYDIRNAGRRHRFTVSDKLVHNCGYGGGAGALIAMGALDMGIPEEDLQDIVTRWRQANKRIVELWYKVENAAISTIQTGKPSGVNGVIFTREFDVENDLDFLTIELPSKRKLYYAHPEIDQNQWGRPSIIYQGVNQTTKQWTTLETYGGKLVENCLSGDTLVLTPRGWISLKNITLADKVWDGEQWVSHEGLIDKGIQKVIDVDGIKMTPNHKIYTSEGWKYALLSARYKRHKVKLPNRYRVRRFRWQEVIMENSLRLWKRSYNAHQRIFERQTEILRLLKNAWIDKTPALSYLAFNERALFSTYLTNMVGLRWGRNQNIQTSAGEFQEFLGRYVVHKTELREQVYDIKNAGPNHCFTVLSNFGAMLVHNCVQAIARDCLVQAIENLEKAGYPIVFHVHDEVVIECDKDKADLDKVIEIMTAPIDWAQGLPINADGWVGDFFRKD